MLKVIVTGVKNPGDVNAAADAGADGVAFIVESKGHPGNVDVTEVVETARLAPPLLNVILDVSTGDEKRLRRAIGSVHPHVVIVPADVDPMILADLQVSFPEVKWFARLEATAYEPFHDAADALVLPGKDAEGAARVKEATRSRVILEDVSGDVDSVRAVRPFAVTTPAGDAGTLTARILGLRAAVEAS
jgi:phosphoribosylanthranilate isomerase